MEKINKAYLPFLVVGAVAVFMFFYDPPHSICHNQLQSYRLSMVGKLYGRRDGKNIIPAKIISAVNSCKTGKTMGSCIDFFDIVNESLSKLNQLDNECMSGLVEEKPLFENSKNFFLIINAIAWGEKVPTDNRDNWLSQSNLYVYCKNKNFLKSILTPEDFENLAAQSIRNFPYEKLPFDFAEDSEEVLTNKAVNKISNEEIVAKSILSIRCEGM